MGEVEDDIDPWSYINDRYETDELAQFALILDGIEEAVRLCGSVRLSDRRMALITADHLADLILVRHVGDVIRVQETASIFEPRKAFDSKARSLLRQRFNRRVDVATRDLSRRFSLGWGQPILTPAEGEIVRVAHAYRNDIYHEDRHSDAALGPVTRAALHAVTQGWLRSQPSRSATSRGVGTPLMNRLLEMGYDTTGWGSRMFSSHEGARAVAAWLATTLPVTTSDDRHELAQDIAARVDWATTMVSWLSGPDGPGADHIQPGLRWVDLWRQVNDDPELVALDAARAMIYEELYISEDGDETTLRLRAEEAESAYNARFQELASSHVPTLTLDDLPRIRREGLGLATTTAPHVLLPRYRKLDEEVRVYEEVLTEMALQWDRFIQEESDRRRGK